jgi:cytochrome b561
MTPLAWFGIAVGAWAALVVLIHLMVRKDRTLGDFGK